jgi:hypothetical protein
MAWNVNNPPSSKGGKGPPLKLDYMFCGLIFADFRVFPENGKKPPVPYEER